MPESICTHMNGSKCAGEYCDYWNNEEQRCSLALESHKRVELLTIILNRAGELSSKAKNKEELIQVIKKLNLVSVSTTLQ